LVQFRWEADRFYDLLHSSHRDEATPYILGYLEKKGPILEAGCGLGRFVDFLEQHGFQDVQGIDISADAVAIVNSLAPHLKVRRGDVSDLPFEDSSIRGIVSLGVVEHFEEGPQVPLREFRRVMMPGARAIISVPYLNPIRRFKQRARIYHFGEGLRALRAATVRAESGGDVISRSIAYLKHDGAPLPSEDAAPFTRWPATGPFFEYRFRPVQFAQEIIAVGLTILEMAPIDAVSGMFYEFGSLMVTASADGERNVTGLGAALRRVLAGATWVHAHMLLFVVEKRA
jgi:SAM-dependent methyltransferase